MRILTTNNTLKNACIALVMAILAVTTYSCKSSKETSPGSMKERSETELLHAVTNNSIKYHTLSANLKANIKFGKNNKNVSSSASLRLIKDDKLQLSFQPLFGFEVFKMVMSKDSIVLIDRMHKMYVAESINDLKNKADFDFDFYNLQALFTNQLFIAGKTEITDRDYHLFSIEQSKHSALIKSKDRQNVYYTFMSDYTDKIKSTEMGNKEGTKKMIWAYDNFGATTDAQSFPMLMKMSLTLPTDEMNMDFSFSKVEPDKSDMQQIDLNIPSKYERISLDQAMKIIESILN